ncbi:uncharacterized protein LOC122499680 [Leptopilina heterotoma]|uniref:uncharacterized protein LOC122499680 n=1 Tax=Leptopilina heterotoma TaxID=63436 RepID=UPI001CA9B498|nr:uncharacterized protein LOC122499680 [Leptopilina heterotoma]
MTRKAEHHRLPGYIRFQRMQQLVQHFWKRWSLEYLAGLQARCKWDMKDVEAVKLESLVILKDDNTAPAQWRIGRVVEAHPGKDGLSRVFSVRTATGIVRRALTKLCPLPCDEEHKD